MVRSPLPIKTAAELADPALEARWQARQAERRGDVFRAVLRGFLAREGPVPVEAVTEALPGRDAGAVGRELADLHDRDLLLLADGVIQLAYPFSGRPTDFEVALAGGRRRYACCAIDALGIAAMLDAAVRIRSRCHHCGEPLAFRADGTGPGPDAAGLMVWVGRRGDDQRRVSASL
jgi:hypothetical protein